MTLNDAMYTSLGTAGYTGALNDRLSQWLSSIGFDGPINEAWHAYLGSLGFAGAFPDRLKQWYTSLGGQGTVNDAALHCWVNNLTLGFAIVYEQTYQLRDGDPSGTKVGQYSDINANGVVVYNEQAGAVGLSVDVNGNVTTTSTAVYGEPLRTLSATGQDDGGLGAVSDIVAMAAAAAAIPVNITTQPQPQSINDGQTASLSVAATGTAPITYPWQDDRSGSFADVIDGTGDGTTSYTTAALFVADTGRQYRCNVTNPAGSITSDVAAVTVTYVAITGVTFTPSSPTITENTDTLVATLAMVGGETPVTLWECLTPGYEIRSVNEVHTTGRPRGVDTVAVRVTDSAAQTYTDTVDVTVSAVVPTVTIDAPLDGADVTAATVITLGGNLTSAEVSVDAANWTAYSAGSAPSPEATLPVNPDSNIGDGFTANVTWNTHTGARVVCGYSGGTIRTTQCRFNVGSLGAAPASLRIRFKLAVISYVAGDFPLTVRVWAEKTADSAELSSSHHYASGWLGDTTTFVDWVIPTLPAVDDFLYTDDLMPIFNELATDAGGWANVGNVSFRLLTQSNTENKTMYWWSRNSGTADAPYLYETHLVGTDMVLGDIPQYGLQAERLYARNSDPGVASIAINPTDAGGAGFTLTSPVSGISFAPADTIDVTGPATEASLDAINWTAVNSGVTTLGDLTGTPAGGAPVSLHVRETAALTSHKQFDSEWNAGLGATRHSTRCVIVGTEGKRIGGCWTNYGGSGRHVYPPITPTLHRVTNTNLSGAGSLREGLDIVGPAIIVFDTSGVLDMNNAEYQVTQPYKTILLNTAPAPGFHLQNGSFVITAEHIASSDLEVYCGEGKMNEDAIEIRYGSNIHFKRALAAFSTDECLAYYGGTNTSPDAENITDIGATDCLIAYPTGVDANHNYGSMAGFNNARILWLRCGFVGSWYRNPFIFGPGSASIIGCKAIVPKWAKTSGSTSRSILLYGKVSGSKVVNVDVIGCYYGQHDAEANTMPNWYMLQIESSVANGSLYYLSGNDAAEHIGLVENKGGSSQSVDAVQDLDGITLTVAADIDAAWHAAIGPRPWNRNSFVTGAVSDLLANRSDRIVSMSEKGGYPAKVETTSAVVITQPWDQRDEQGYLLAERELMEMER